MQDMAPRVGTNLSLDFDADPLIRSFFREGIDPLRFIKDGGMTFIELPMKEGFEEATVLGQARKCHSAGLQVNLHPYHKELHGCGAFERSPDNLCFATTLRILATADLVSREQDRPCVLNFHPASNTGMIDKGGAWSSRTELAARSADYFQWIAQTATDRKLDLVITAEFQCPPAEKDPDGLLRVGDTYRELMDVAKGASSAFGICWDTGHAHLAHIRYGEPLHPPDRFVAMVRHVHLHNVDGLRDHMPLNIGSVPYRDHISSLVAAGFAGDINIELHHRWCLERGHSAKQLFESAELVRHALSGK